MTVLELIQAAFRVLNIGVDGEDLEANEQTNGREALNLLLASWCDEGIVYPYTVEVTKTLTAGTESYTIGESSADIDTLKPELIVDAFIRDSSNNDYPVQIIGEKSYNVIYDKQAPATRPYRLHYKHGAPNGTIYLHPSPPNSTDTLYLYGIRSFPEVGTTEGWDSANLETGTGIARSIHRALKWNLAVELIPEYGPPPNVQFVVAMAEGTYESLRERNIAKNLEPIRSELAPPHRYQSNEGLF